MKSGNRWVSALPWAVLALCACAGNRSEPLRGPMKVTDTKVASGQVVFMEKCDRCHPGGDGGLGPAINNKPMPEFMLRYQTRHGLGAMPAFDEEEISEAQLDALVDYLKALRQQG